MSSKEIATGLLSDATERALLLSEVAIGGNLNESSVYLSQSQVGKSQTQQPDTVPQSFSSSGPVSVLAVSPKHDLVFNRMIESLETSMLSVFGEDLKRLPNWNGRVGEPNDFDGSKYYVDTMTRMLGFTTIKKCKPENNKLVLLCERFGECHSRRIAAENGDRPRKTKKCGCEWMITLGNFCQGVTLANGTNLASGVYVIAYSNYQHNHELTSDTSILESLSPSIAKGTPSNSINNNGNHASVVEAIHRSEVGGVIDISRSQKLRLRHQLNELATLLCLEHSGVHYGNLLYILRHIHETKGSTLEDLKQFVANYNSRRKKAPKRRKVSESNSESGTAPEAQAPSSSPQ